MSTQLCISCRTPVGDRRSYTWTSRESQHTEVAQFVIEDLLVRQEEHTEVIRRPCWQRAEYRYLRHQREVDHDVADEELNAEPHASPTVLPGFSRTGNSANMCIYQHCQNATRRRIPKDIILRMLCRYSLFITENSRVCSEHLEQGE